MRLSRQECQRFGRYTGSAAAVAGISLVLAGCASMTERHYAAPFPAPMSSGTPITNAEFRSAIAPRSQTRRSRPRSAATETVVRQELPTDQSPGADERNLGRAPQDDMPVRRVAPARVISAVGDAPPAAPNQSEQTPAIESAAPELPVPHPGGDLESRMAALAPQPQPSAQPLPEGADAGRADIETAAPTPPAQQTAPISSPTAPTRSAGDDQTAETPTAPPNSADPGLAAAAEPGRAARLAQPQLLNPPATPDRPTVEEPNATSEPPAKPDVEAPTEAEKLQERAPTATADPAEPAASTTEDTTLARTPEPQDPAPSRTVTVEPTSPEPSAATQPPETGEPSTQTARATVPEPPAQLEPQPPTQPAPVQEPPPAVPAARLTDIQCPELAGGGQDPDCQSALTRLLLDQSNDWVARPPTAADYVSGARLVAFAQLRNRLTCPQLKTGLDEAQTAIVALRAAIDGETAVGRPTGRLVRTRELAVVAKARLEAADNERC